MHIENHKVVSIHYTLTNDAGEILDSSDQEEPLAYIHGIGNIIPGLETALTGRVIGDKLTVRIAASDGYGERDEDLVQRVSRNAFETADEILPGMQFHAESPEGVRVVTVLEASEHEVLLDGNHPMAGVALTFAVEVTDIRDATADELSHGHVHGPGGHHHH